MKQSRKNASPRVQSGTRRKGFNMTKMTKDKVRVKQYFPSGEIKERVFSGQVAKSARALIKAKQKGVTALEVASWALRLAAYIHILRKKFDVDIVTQREKHKTGWHGRYHLKSRLTIMPD